MYRCGKEKVALHVDTRSDMLCMCWTYESPPLKNTYLYIYVYVYKYEKICIPIQIWEDVYRCDKKKILYIIATYSDMFCMIWTSETPISKKTKKSWKDDQKHGGKKHKKTLQHGNIFTTKQQVWATRFACPSIETKKNATFYKNNATPFKKKNALLNKEDCTTLPSYKKKGIGNFKK